MKIWILFAGSLLFSQALIAQLPIKSVTKDSSIQTLLEMSEALDRQDSQDFSDLINEADRCTAYRDYSCSERALTKAKSLATGNKQRQRLQLAKQTLDDEKERQAREERERREEEARHQERMERFEREAQQRQWAMEREADQGNRVQNIANAAAAAWGANMGRPQNNLERMWTQQSRDLARIQDDGNRQRAERERMRYEEQRRYQEQQREADRDRRERQFAAQQAEQRAAEESRREQERRAQESRHQATTTRIASNTNPAVSNMTAAKATNNAGTQVTGAAPPAASKWTPPASPTGNEACENARKQTRVPFTETGKGGWHTEEGACRYAMNEANGLRDQKVFLCPEINVRTSVSIGSCQCQQNQSTGGWGCRVEVSSSILPSYISGGPATGVSR